MSDPKIVPPGPAPKRRFLPELRSPWWTVLLGLSLMVNLLVVGAVVGARFHDGGWPRPNNQSRAQLLPRKFFGDLPRERRRELMDVLKSGMDQVEPKFDNADQVALKLADVLEQPSYDSAATKVLVDDFTSGRNAMASQGGTVIMAVLDKLTPEERKILAGDIRDRATRRPHK